MWKCLRKWHWITSLAVVLQFFIWSFTGSYMVLMDIGFIRGNHIITPPKAIHHVSETIGDNFNEILLSYPQAEKIKLVLSTPTPEVHITANQQFNRYDAITAERLDSIDNAYITHQAEQWYASTSPIQSITLLQTAPSEISARHQSVWQVNYQNTSDHTLYFSAQSGDLVGKRHNYWRIFDWFWRFHIMDYWEGENIHNIFLSILSLLTFITASFGVSLLGPWVKHHANKRKS